MLLSSLKKVLCPETGIALVSFVHRVIIDKHPESKNEEFFIRAQQVFGFKCTYLGISKKYVDVDDGDGDDGDGDKNNNCDTHLRALHFCSLPHDIVNTLQNSLL